MRDFWRVTVERVHQFAEDERGNIRERTEEIYKQRVNELDLGAIIDAANISDVPDHDAGLELAHAFGE